MPEQANASNESIPKSGATEITVDEHLRWTRQRTLLANERNLHGWIRTGLTAEAAGLGIARLLHSTGWLSVARASGIVLVLAGGIMFLLALRRYRLINHELQKTGIKRTTPTWIITFLITVLLLSAILAFLLLFQE